MAAGGRWVPAFELAAVGGLQFQTRVHELRHGAGLNIENKIEHVDGQVRSSYRLKQSQEPQQSAPAQELPRSTTLPLFIPSAGSEIELEYSAAERRRQRALSGGCR